MSGIEPEEVQAIWGTLGRMGAWAGKGAYHTAQKAGMRFQNWRWGAAGSDDSSSPATTSDGAGKGGKWASVEQHRESTLYYHTSSDTKWSR